MKKALRFNVGLGAVLLLLANFFASGTLQAQTQTFTSDGTFTVPVGVTNITVECWGGGGRGGTRNTDGVGGGGGGGAYSRKVIPVLSGNAYSVTVGAGSTTTAAGGDSWFGYATWVMAKGGNSAADNSATGASGGSAASSFGDTKYNGGAGATGNTAGTDYGGGGGSSAGTGMNGATATNQNGATAPTGGGNGGSGRFNTEGNGTAGTAPGGGGGGAIRDNGTDTGGAGADGQVVITWTVPTIETFTSGSGTYTVPAGVYCIVVQAWGGGGGGGSIAAGDDRRGGGGGGAYAGSTLSVTPGQMISYTVGTAGAVGTAGGDSDFGGLVIAKGGGSTTNENGGTGGDGASSTGQTTFSGGAGGDGTNNGGGGGGGGSAFTDSNGGDGTNGGGSAGGPGGAGTGDGGTGGDEDGSPAAQAGIAPGGGGGGRGDDVGSSAAGAAGQITITILPQKTITSSGTFTVPTGVTSITVHAWGGGGTPSNTAGEKGGGGGGAYASRTIPVMPGDMYTVHVGAAGTAGNAGEASYFNINSLVDVASVVAAGGGGTTGTSGGTGGTTANSNGTTEFAGGDGGAAGSGGGDDPGGGGGGSAFSTADGGDGVSPGGSDTGGTGGTGTGDGGRGADSDGSPDAIAGGAPGGGGGGKGDNGTSQPGAAGQVIVTWEYSPVACTDPDVPTVSASPTTICAGGSSTLSITGGNLNDATDWQWYTGSCGGTSAGSGTSIMVSPGLTTYYVRGEGGCVTAGSCATVSVTVVADPAAPTATKSPDVATVCAGQMLTLTGVTDNGGGTGTCIFEYSHNGGGWVSTLTPFAAAVGSNTIAVRRNCDGAGCNISTETTYTWTGVADPATPTATKSPDVATVCAGQMLTLTGVTDNGGGTGTCIFEYSHNGGGWVSTLTPFAAAVGSNTIAVRRNCDGAGCDISTETTYTWTGVANPVVTLDLLDDQCYDGGTTFLTNDGMAMYSGLPSGGSYSGSGVSMSGADWIFDATATGGVGGSPYTITYNYTDGNGCSGMATDQMTVYDGDVEIYVDGLTPVECMTNATFSIKTDNFTDLINLGTARVSWDNTKWQYVTSDPAIISGITTSLNAMMAASGYLTFDVNATGSGITLADGTALLTVELKALTCNMATSVGVSETPGGSPVLEANSDEVAPVMVSTTNLNVNLQDTQYPTLDDPLVTCASLDMSGIDQCLSTATAFDPNTLETAVAALYKDNCDANLTATYTTTDAGSGNSNCAWTFTYNFTIADDCGNDVPCSVTYSGSDQTAPSGTAPSGTSNINACYIDASTPPVGTPAFNAATAAAGYNDNCPGNTVTATLTNTAVTGNNCSWTVTYTFKVADNCGNELLNQTIQHTGGDKTAPSGTAPSGTANINACYIDGTTPPVGTPAFNAATAAAGYNDNCPGNTVTATLTNTAVTGNNCAWTVTYTFKVADNCGNELLSQTMQHTGGDKTAPTGTAPSGTANINACYIDASTPPVGTPAFNAATAAAGYNDNCPGNTVTATLTNTAVSGNDMGWTVTYTFKVADNCGNELLNQTIQHTGKDMTLPTAVCQDVTVELDANGNGTLTASQVNNGSSDACGPVTLSLDNTTFDCNDIGAAAAGGSVTVNSSNGFSVTIELTPTTVSAPGTCPFGYGYTTNIVYKVTYGGTPPPGALYTLQGTLNCAPANSSFPILTDNEFTNNGMTMMGTTTTSNAYNNATNCVGVTPAILNCNSVQLAISGLGISYQTVNVPITYGGGGQTVTLTVTDEGGNTKTCTANVTVEDNLPPTGTAPSGTANINACYINANTPPAGTPAFNATAAAAGYTDNCGSVTATLTNTAVTGNNCAWTVTYTFKVADANGNELLNQTIQHTGGDKTAPTGTAPSGMANINACYINASTPPVGTPAFNATTAAAGYSDNCPGNTVTATLTNTAVTGNNCLWTVTYTFKVADNCGNELLNQTIQHTGGDKTAPTGTAPLGMANINACYINASTPPVGTPAFNATTAAAGYSDNCPGNTVTATLTNTAVTGYNCSWTVTYTFKVADNCGNELLNQTILHTGSDQTAPSGTAPSGTANINACYIDASTPPVGTPAFNAATAAAGYNDNCPGNTVTATLTNTAVTGDNCFWTVTYTFKVADNCGNELLNQTIQHTGGDTQDPALLNANVDCSSLNIAGVNECLSAAEAWDASQLEDEVKALYGDNCDNDLTVTLVTNGNKSPINDDCSWSFTYEYLIEDNCGNSVTCMVTRSGGDSQDPALLNANVDCSSLNIAGVIECLSAAEAWDATQLEDDVKALYGDNCDNNLTVTLVTNGNKSPINNDCSWSFTYEYTIEDNCGNSVTCMVTRSGGDTQDPALLNANVDCSSLNITNVNECLSVAEAWDASQLEDDVKALYGDNCDNNLTVTLVTNGNRSSTIDSDCSWSFTYEYLIEDNCGNSVTCMVTRSGGDNTIPVITLTGNATVEICQNETYMDAGATAMDNCTGDITANIVTNNPVNTAVPNTYIVTYDVMDACGNPAVQVTRTVTVKPIPEISGTVNGDAFDSNPVDNASVEICDGDAPNFSIFSTVPGSGVCVYYQPVLSNIDPSVNGGIWELQNNYIGDVGNLNWLFNFNGDYLKLTNPALPGSVTWTLTPVLTGSCSGSVPAPGDCLGNPVTITVTVKPIPEISGTVNGDAFDSNPVDNASVEICDGDAPNFSIFSTVPGSGVCVYYQPVLSNIDPSVNGGIWELQNNYIGDVGNLNWLFSSNGDYLKLTNPALPGTVTWTLTPVLTGSCSGSTPAPGDCLGNQVTITVTVNPLPAANVTGNTLVCIGTSITLNGNPTDGSGIYSAHGWTQSGAGSVSITNNNDGTAGIQGVIAGSVTIEYTVTDMEGCTATDTYTFTVTDCGAITFVNDRSPNDPCSCNNDQTANGAQDGTFGETVSVTPTTNVETWTVVAVNRLAGSGGLPSGIAVNDQLTYDAGGFHAIHFQHVDDAGYTIIVEGPNPGVGTPGNPAQGNQQYTLSNICQYPVIAFDPTLPDNVCLNSTPIALTVSEANSFAGLATFTVDGNAATEFDPSAPLTPPGPYAVVANFTGSFASNISTDVNNPAFPGCITDISDAIGIYASPTVSCPGPIVLNTSSDDTGDCDAEQLLNHPDIGTGCATDLDISFTNGAPAPPYLPTGGLVTPNGSDTYAFAAGQTIVTYTATDAANNVSSCMFTVTVTDDEDPTAICPGPETVTCATNVPAPNPALVNASDNCGIVLKEHWYTTLPYNVQCLNQFQVTRYYRVYDAEGNSATCAQVITVFDDMKPTFTFVPANVTVQCNSVPAVGNPTADDNCIGPVTITYDGQTRVDGSCTDAYVLTRKWTATDACGNTRTATQRITVIDTQKPNFTSTPANITVQCDAIPLAVAPTATDNCDGTVAITVLPETKTNGACANAYTLTRRWVASDNCNNTRSISQRITVVDNGKPTLMVPMDLTIACTASIPLVGTPSASDGCGGNVAIVYLGQSSMNATCPGNYQLRRTWKATDVCGNSTAATQTITVVDNVAPVFVSVPNNVTIQCHQAPPALGNPVATDNCSGPASITYLGQVRTDGNCLYNYTLTRTWRATDQCGNSTTTAQVITVQDTQAPTFTNPPANVTVVCAPDCVPPPVTPNATDNCGTPTVTLQQTQSPGDCSTGYTVTRTWTATDQCGNPKVHVQTFTVLPTPFAPPSPNRDQDQLNTQHSTLKTVSLTPNPTTDRVLIGLGDFAGETVVVSIYSDLGQLIWQRKVEAVADLKLPVNLREAGAAAGLYTVSVRGGGQVVSKRLVLVE